MRIRKRILHVLLSGSLILGSIGSGGNWTIGSVTVTEAAEAVDAADDGLLIIKDTFLGYTGDRRDITIPEGVKTVRFEEGWGGVTLYIPAGVTNINLSDSAEFGSLSVDAKNPVYSSIDGSLYNKKKSL